MSGYRQSAAHRILAVAGITFREAWRRWVVIAAFVMTLGFLGLYGTGLFFVARDIAAQANSFGAGVGEMMQNVARVQIVQTALFPASLIVSLTAVFASVASISGDLDSGIMYGVLTRPIRRFELVLGKFVGIGAMLIVYSLFLVGAVVGLGVLFIDVPLDNVAGAMALFVLEPLILLAVALLGSSRLPTLANGVVCMALYGVSFIGGVIEQIGSLLPNQVMLDIGVVTSLLLPVDAVHRKAMSELMPAGLQLANAAQGMGFGTSATPSAWMIVYAVCYTGLAVWLAARVLAKRDL